MYAHPQHGKTPEKMRETQDLRRQGGQWLRSLREARGLSQLDLARLLELEYYTFISQIESGRGRIPPERYGAWAEALGWRPRDFVIEVLRYYDPVTFGFLFGDASGDVQNMERDSSATVGAQSVPTRVKLVTSAS